MVLEWGAVEEEVLVVDGLFIGPEAGVDAFKEEGEGFGGFVENLDGVGGMVTVGDDDVQCGGHFFGVECLGREVRQECARVRGG